MHASTSSHVNIRHLNTPQRSQRYNSLKARCKAAELKIKRLKENIHRINQSGSIEVDQSLDNDLSQIMKENENKIVKEFPENSFQQLFWKQQFQALQVSVIILFVFESSM